MSETREEIVDEAQFLKTVPKASFQHKPYDEYDSYNMSFQCKDIEIIHHDIKYYFGDITCKLRITLYKDTVHYCHDTVGEISFDTNGISGHPHVNCNGGVCLGDAREKIINSLAAGHLIPIYDIMCATLETYNPEDPHYEIENFAKGSETCSICGDVKAPFAKVQNTYICSLSCYESCRSINNVIYLPHQFLRCSFCGCPSIKGGRIQRRIARRFKCQRCINPIHMPESVPF